MKSPEQKGAPRGFPLPWATQDLPHSAYNGQVPPTYTPASVGGGASWKGWSSWQEGSGIVTVIIVPMRTREVQRRDFLPLKPEKVLESTTCAPDGFANQCRAKSLHPLAKFRFPVCSPLPASRVSLILAMPLPASLSTVFSLQIHTRLHPTLKKSLTGPVPGT